MLLRFSASNFTSIRDFQEISMIASSLSGDPSATIETPALSQRVLRTAAIYGPNASGKTNLLWALRFMRGAVRDSHSQWDPTKEIKRHPFALDESQTRPTELSIDLIIDGVRYEYGFSVDNVKVLSEFLYAYPEKRRQIWFERSAESERINFGKNFTGENRTIENLTRPNSLFLSAAAQNNHDKLMPIFKWFANDLVFRANSGSSGAYERTIEMCSKDESTKERVVQLLAGADVGVVGINITEEQPDEKFSSFAVKFSNLLSEFADEPIEIPAFDQKIRSVTLQHRAGVALPVSIPLSEESAGTLSFLAMIGPAMEVLSSGGVLCIDEISANLHPLLAEEIVKIFNRGETNPLGAQLLFTTHSTELLGAGVLRRDEIWFTEKDDQGVTRLYPMTDFKPRRYENLQRGYLQGRYGATPFIRSSVLTGIGDEAQE